MPVLVTAADEPLSRRIALRLLQEGGEVRAYASGDTAALRAAGAFVASGDADDEGRLEAALAEVHTLVHVGGGVLDDPERIEADAAVAARAAENAGVRRVITVSLPGADHAADDAVRRAKAAAEASLTAVPAPTVILRVGLVDTPALRGALLTSGLDRDALAARVAPVRVDDLVELVVAFDRARAESTDGRLVVAADGPTWTSVAGYLDQVTGEGAGRVGRRLPRPEVGARLSALLRGPWAPHEPGTVDGWSFFGIEPGTPGPELDTR